MLTKKLLSIGECQFSLPDDFEGSLGDALLLLANHRLEAEKNKGINREEDINIPCYDKLRTENDIKCAIKYSLSKVSEDGTKWETL